MSLIYLRDEAEGDAPRPLDGWAWAGILFVSVVFVPALVFLALASAMSLASDAPLCVALVFGTILSTVLADLLLRDASSRDRQMGMAVAVLLTPLATVGWVLLHAAHTLA
ncbi:hypothetical protein [Baekduia sp. Peel2402]|uniref:hypothetical protein n=1 Tax=Baekduia sp. Peel2402 TaxID=3458296 RepID=UPI00403E8AB1